MEKSKLMIALGVTDEEFEQMNKNLMEKEKKQKLISFLFRYIIPIIVASITSIITIYIRCN